MADLPVIAELVQYPPAYDGPEGDALADVLSEVASSVWVREQAHGGPAAVDRRPPAIWEGDIRGLLHFAARVSSGDVADPVWRERMVGIAALAVTAVSSWDRLHATQPEAVHG